ncbi:hypothetical protein D6810_01215 [Candidatus Dojkabacteria bacterium]|uniref:Uncharacterized protein n=1 Tax=Candidatus Dojkabacteria bacterium TaxID=2099670 RepID=A0A3M0Z114_9BACT|nr:MAG: hypothetical protein D6810_01215 [Candidatus Dojkabacteria bacterium]
MFISNLRRYLDQGGISHSGLERTDRGGPNSIAPIEPGKAIRTWIDSVLLRGGYYPLLPSFLGYAGCIREDGSVDWELVGDKVSIRVIPGNEVYQEGAADSNYDLARVVGGWFNEVYDGIVSGSDVPFFFLVLPSEVQNEVYDELSKHGRIKIFQRFVGNPAEVYDLLTKLTEAQHNYNLESFLTGGLDASIFGELRETWGRNREKNE